MSPAIEHHGRRARKASRIALAVLCASACTSELPSAPGEAPGGGDAAPFEGGVIELGVIEVGLSDGATPDVGEAPDGASPDAASDGPPADRRPDDGAVADAAPDARSMDARTDGKIVDMRPDDAADGAPDRSLRDAPVDRDPDLAPVDAASDMRPDVHLEPDAGAEPCEAVACFASRGRIGTAPCVAAPIADCGAQRWASCDCDSGGDVRMIAEPPPESGALRRVTVLGRALPELSLKIDERCLGRPDESCATRGVCGNEQHYVWHIAPDVALPGPHRLEVWSIDAAATCGAEGRGFLELTLDASWP